MTIKFPVEVGGNVDMYCPRIRLEHWAGGWFYGDKHGEGKEATYDAREFAIKLVGESSFPYTFSFPGNTDVVMDEIIK
jgi:hypothetical protein